MSHKIVLLGIAILIIIGVGFEYIARKDQKFDGLTAITQDDILKDFETTKRNCISDDCLLVDDLEYPVSGISPDAQQALISALSDEYKAYSTYQDVISIIGPVRPFSMIIRAEENHISALKALFDKYGIETPENTITSEITKSTTLQQACTIGVNSESTNSDLYEKELLPKVTDYPDITNVFTSLMNASRERHLPAFEKCVNFST